MIISQIKELNERTAREILDVWESSVRATHEFLSESDIVFLKSLVEEGLPEVEIIVTLRDRRRKMLAFLGMTGTKVEMLFVVPHMIGKGLGRRLMNYAIEEFRAKEVDVNAANKKARDFYEHLGFKVVDHIYAKGLGGPTPTLHMHLT